MPDFIEGLLSSLTPEDMLSMSANKNCFHKEHKHNFWVMRLNTVMLLSLLFLFYAILCSKRIVCHVQQDSACDILFVVDRSSHLCSMTRQIKQTSTHTIFEHGNGETGCDAWLTSN